MTTNILSDIDDPFFVHNLELTPLKGQDKINHDLDQDWVFLDPKQLCYCDFA